MSEENHEEIKQRWEVLKLEAEVKQTEAQALKLKTESDQIAIQTEKDKLELKTQELDNLLKETLVETRKLDLLITKRDDEKSALDWARALEKREREKAVDEENFLYRFQGEVSGGSVHKCMATLTEWHRMAPKCNIEVIFS